MSPKADFMRLAEPKDLGKLIRARRRALGLTQSRLANLAVVGRQWLVALEKGETRAPLDRVIKVVGVLGFVLELADIDPSHAMLSAHLRPSFKGDEKAKSAAPRQVDMTPVKQPHRKILRPEHPLDGKVLWKRYEVAELESIGIELDRERLYDAEYRPSLTRLVAKVVVTEGPVFEKLVARRIASAHRLPRATSKLAEVVASIAEENFPSTMEGDRKIIWSEHPESLTLPAFRTDTLGLRDHADIPLVELAALAVDCLSRGYSSERSIAFMGEQFGLARVMAATRARLVEAIRLGLANLPGARE